MVCENRQWRKDHRGPQNATETQSAVSVLHLLYKSERTARWNVRVFWDDSGEQLDNRLKETCLTSKEFCDYLGEKVGYGWHISNLKIYDPPRDLWEFTGLRETKFGLAPGQITRPPQSWRYVEEELWSD